MIPWNSIGFQILVTWMALILIFCWFGGRLEKTRKTRHHEPAVDRWRAGRDRRTEDPLEQTWLLVVEESIDRQDRAA